MISPAQLNKIFMEEDGILYWRINMGQRGRPGKVAGFPRVVKGECRWYIQLYGDKYFRSRLIFAMYFSRWPAEGLVIDHVDGDTLNDDIRNLREVTQKINMENRRRPWGHMKR